MARPRTALPPLPAAKKRTAASLPTPVFVPSSSIRITALVAWSGAFVLALDPDCVYPSTVTGPVICGSALAGEMVWTPEPTIAKPIVSAPPAALASRIAWRREPAPLSAVVVTV